MSLRVLWQGDTIYPEHASAVRAAVEIAIKETAGSEWNAFQMKNKWDEVGRPAGRHGWPKVLEDLVSEVRKNVPPAIFHRYPGLRVEFLDF